MDIKLDNTVWTNISAYVQENYDSIKAELVLGGETLSLFDSIPVGIEGTIKVPKLTVDIVSVDNCSSTPTGATSFLQTSVKVCRKNYLTTLCEDNFRLYFPVQGMSNTLGQNIPFEQTIIQTWEKEIQKEKERLYWFGTTAGGDCMDGIYYSISGDSSRNIASGTTFYPGVTITSSLIDDAVDAVYAALPANVSMNNSRVVYMFMSQTLYKWYRQWAIGAYGALQIGNAGQSTEGGPVNIMDYVYDSNVKIVGVQAFGSSQAIIAGAVDNFIHINNGTSSNLTTGMAPYDSGLWLKWSYLLGAKYHWASELATSF